MSVPTPDITLDVDLRNPGQFFACCGLLELASRLWPGSEGWFAGSGSRAAFHVATASGHNDPLGEVVAKLCDGDELVRIAQDEGIDKLQADRQPVTLVPFDLRLDWWLDSYGDGDKSELKVWAGQQTPARNINGLRQAWREIRARAAEEPERAATFADRWPTTGRFGFDPAASWDALDIGFSPDEQGIPVRTSPSTEILAAVGLQRCRPSRIEGRGRWFRYQIWTTPLAAMIAPAAIVGACGNAPGYAFPVAMRNAQYGSFGWARPLEETR